MYGSKTDKGRGTTHAWCSRCDWGTHGRNPARRTREKRQWLKEAWNDALENMHPTHAELPVFVRFEEMDMELRDALLGHP